MGEGGRWGRKEARGGDALLLVVVVVVVVVRCNVCEGAREIWERVGMQLGLECCALERHV